MYGVPGMVAYMDHMNKESMKRFYADLLQYNFIPYWSNYVDDEYGGILNCINNNGDRLLAGDKFTWSQGRWLWILGRIHALCVQGVFPALDRQKLERWMKGTWEFLEQYSLYDDCICCYVLSRDGQKKRDGRTGRYDASIYADCFALIGMSQYVKTMDYREGYPVTEALYQSIARRIESGDFLTEPYPIPEGYAIHGIPMILINTVHEFILMKLKLGMDAAEEIAYARGKLEFILEELYDGRGHIREHKSTAGRGTEYLLDRHLNPGHTLEDAWFWVEFLEQFGGLSEYLPRICEIVKTTFEAGWDHEFGGLLRFVDCEGGQPKGRQEGSAYEELVTGTWDMKLWWPHSELLYLFPKLYEATGDEVFWKYYEKSFTYAFTTFPNLELGEWVQIRRRDGSPEEKLVALPVKDPFHIMRNFIKIVELCL